MVENNFKAFGPQLFTEHAEPIEAMDGGRVAPVALQPAQRCRQLLAPPISMLSPTCAILRELLRSASALAIGVELTSAMMPFIRVKPLGVKGMSRFGWHFQGIRCIASKKLRVNARGQLWHFRPSSQ